MRWKGTQWVKKEAGVGGDKGGGERLLETGVIGWGMGGGKRESSLSQGRCGSQDK